MPCCLFYVLLPMNWFKPRQSVRRVMPTLSTPGRWRRKGISAVPKDQKVWLRARKKGGGKKVETLSTQRGVSRKWGVGSRQWLANRVESWFLLTVSFFIVLKSGTEFLLDLFLSGWELLARGVAPLDDVFDPFDDIAVTDHSKGETPLDDLELEGRVAWAEETHVHREDVEMAKMFVLATEEKDLPEELLGDQAGALRSMLAAVPHEDAKR